MDRYTQAMVTKKAQTFARLMGKEYGEKPGNYFLDHTASYGGYTLVEVTDCNGQRNPFGSKRRRAEAMYDTLDFACEAIRLQQEATEASQRPDSTCPNCHGEGWLNGGSEECGCCYGRGQVAVRLS